MFKFQGKNIINLDEDSSLSDDESDVFTIEDEYDQELP